MNKLDKHEEQELLISREGAVATVTLNRPKALNALSLHMIRGLTAAMEELARDETVATVILKGAGGRAFCAGGDIKAAYEAGLAAQKGEIKAHYPFLFYGEEYRLNRMLFHYKKPLIALMDGIVMGGGYGLAGPCRYRIISEGSVFAMPEVGIGFFPDVGSLYFLSRYPDKAGYYLGLTGATIGYEDMLYCGAASHCIPQARQADFLDDLLAGLNAQAQDKDQYEVIEAAVKRYETIPEKAGPLENNRDAIKACFQGDRVEDVIKALAESDAPWAEEQRALLQTRSPASLKVTWEYFRRTQGKSFDEIIALDFVLAQHFMQGHDFFEGVRALLVDKDKSPQWRPSSLADVDQDMVGRYFSTVRWSLDDVETMKAA